MNQENNYIFDLKKCKKKIKKLYHMDISILLLVV